MAAAFVGHFDANLRKYDFEKKKNEKIKEHQTAQNELCRKNLDNNNKTIKQKRAEIFSVNFL